MDVARSARAVPSLRSYVPCAVADSCLEVWLCLAMRGQVNPSLARAYPPWFFVFALGALLYLSGGASRSEPDGLSLGGGQGLRFRL